MVRGLRINQPIMHTFLHHDVVPDKILYNGSKIMYRHVAKGLYFTFLDSLNFLGMRFSKGYTYMPHLASIRFFVRKLSPGNQFGADARMDGWTDDAYYYSPPSMKCQGGGTKKNGRHIVAVTKDFFSVPTQLRFSGRQKPLTRLINSFRIASVVKW